MVSAATKTEAAIRQKPAQGMGMLKMAKTLGVGVSTVQRVKAVVTGATE